MIPRINSPVLADPLRTMFFLIRQQYSYDTLSQKDTLLKFILAKPTGVRFFSDEEASNARIFKTLVDEALYCSVTLRLRFLPKRFVVEASPLSWLKLSRHPDNVCIHDVSVMKTKKNVPCHESPRLCVV